MEKDKLYYKYESIIEEIASRYRTKAFSFYEESDIEQEVRIICYKALESFDEEIASVKTYLTRCVSNRLSNFKRDKYYRLENPCYETKCPMYNVFTKSCTSNTYPEICDKLNKSKNKMQRQISVTNPVSINEEESEFDFECQHINNHQLKVVNEEIRKRLVGASGENFAKRYDDLLDSGVNKISKEEIGFFYSIAENVVYGK